MSQQPRLSIVPCELAEANVFVKQHHRHHQPVVGHRFSLAIADEQGAVRGVAIVGRPVARMLQDGWTLEVTRLATDGCANACSALYAAAWRAARAMGYRKLITYILKSEPGTSLIAAGWKCIGQAGGGTWSRPSRPRVDTHPLQGKIRWEMEALPSSRATDACLVRSSVTRAVNSGTPTRQRRHRAMARR